MINQQNLLSGTNHMEQLIARYQDLQKFLKDKLLLVMGTIVQKIIVVLEVGICLVSEQILEIKMEMIFI